MSGRPHPAPPSTTAPAPAAFKNSLRVNIYPDTFFVVMTFRRRLPPRAIIRQAAPVRLRDHVRFATFSCLPDTHHSRRHRASSVWCRRQPVSRGGGLLPVRGTRRRGGSRYRSWSEERGPGESELCPPGC